MFFSIVDKIKQKAANWSSMFLSSAGKLVPLQSVMSVMPTYGMTCFKLPQSLCKRIQSALARFWWDASPENQKIRWMAWEKMAKPKWMGGLGFKDMRY